ncbi:MAG: hypothetical protein IJT94_03555 [Oscillibacter sp.]|nr:hypothetical protein [Oscillibacter sp.]
MSDKLFVLFLRFLLDSLEGVHRETDEKKRDERLNKIIKHLQDAIED